MAFIPLLTISVLIFSYWLSDYDVWVDLFVVVLFPLSIIYLLLPPFIAIAIAHIVFAIKNRKKFPRIPLTIIQKIWWILVGILAVNALLQIFLFFSIGERFWLENDLMKIAAANNITVLTFILLFVISRIFYNAFRIIRFVKERKRRGNRDV